MTLRRQSYHSPSHPGTSLVTNETFAAPLTASGRGAIAVVGVHGPLAQQAVLRCFQPARPISTAGLSKPTIRYGHWQGPTVGQVTRTGESVIVLFLAGDDCEVHCHGGTAAVQAILRDLEQAGVAIETSDRWLTRTVGNAEQVTMDRLALNTNTRWTAALAVAQQQGAMRNWAQQMSTRLSQAERTNRREEDSSVCENHFQNVVDEIAAAAGQLCQHAIAGEHLVAPWRIVLAGPPNVGKSSLMNSLLGYQRTITFDQPGTTRDIVSAHSALRGWPIELSDTAGLRISDDPLESAGVRRASALLDEADLILAVVDAKQGLTEHHQAIFDRCTAVVVPVLTKIDLIDTDTDLVSGGAQFVIFPELATAAQRGSENRLPIPVVAPDPQTLTPLIDAIEAALIPATLRYRPSQPDTNEAWPPVIPVTKLQREWASRLAQATTATAVWQALSQLGASAIRP